MVLDTLVHSRSGTDGCGGVGVYDERRDENYNIGVVVGPK